MINMMSNIYPPIQATAVVMLTMSSAFWSNWQAALVTSHRYPSIPVDVMFRIPNLVNTFQGASPTLSPLSIIGLKQEIHDLRWIDVWMTENKGEVRKPVITIGWNLYGKSVVGTCSWNVGHWRIVCFPIYTAVYGCNIRSIFVTKVDWIKVSPTIHLPFDFNAEENKAYK